MAVQERIRNRPRAFPQQDVLFRTDDKFTKKPAKALLQCPGLCGI
jgi:hypothetical protein